jgi:hypothetical protein
LIAWLKANPNKASAAVVNVGARLLATAFQKETGTQFVLVPYRGTAPAMQDLVAGHIEAPILRPQRAGRSGSVRGHPRGHAQQGSGDARAHRAGQARAGDRA